MSAVDRVAELVEELRPSLTPAKHCEHCDLPLHEGIGVRHVTMVLAKDQFDAFGEPCERRVCFMVHSTTAGADLGDVMRASDFLLRRGQSLAVETGEVW